MGTLFVIKQHDQLPDLVITLLNGEDPVDLTTALSARVLIRNLAGLKVDQLCVISDQTVNANLGIVTYAWGALDTDTVGTYNGEIEVIWGDGKTQTFPAENYFKLQVTNDLTD